VTRSEAYTLAVQLESLNREYRAKRADLQRAWEKAQRKVRDMDAAIECLATIRFEKRDLISALTELEKVLDAQVDNGT
jgi:hypothetical protein